MKNGRICPAKICTSKQGQHGDPCSCPKAGSLLLHCFLAHRRSVGGRTGCVHTWNTVTLAKFHKAPSVHATKHSFLFTYSLASYTVSHHASLNLSFLLSGIVNKLKTLCFFIYDAFKRGKFVSSINLHLQHSAPSCKTPRCITAQKHSSKKNAWFHHITLKE